MGDLRTALSLLSPVNAGEKLVDVLTSARINAIQDAIRCLCIGENISRGENIRLQKGDGWVKISASQKPADQAPAVEAVTCHLEVYDATPDPTPMVPTPTKLIGVRWGTINGMQPSGFHAGGYPVFTISVSGYPTALVYASATLDLSTLVWGNPTVTKSLTALANTTTTAHTLIGSWATHPTTGKLLIESSCGDVTFSSCSLSAS